MVALAAHANLHKGLTRTPAGRRTWTRVMKLIARRNEDIFGCLSQAEQRQLGKLVDRLIEHAQAAA